MIIMALRGLKMLEFEKDPMGQGETVCRDEDLTLVSVYL